MSASMEPDGLDERCFVCVVDGDQEVRKSIKELLESAGLKVQTFSSAAELLSVLESHEVGCVVSAVRMPGLSGLELQAELAKSQSSPPIIFLTAHGDIPMSVEAMKRGAMDFFCKPVREQDLLDAVNRALNRHNAQRDAYRKRRELKMRYASLSMREKEVMRLVCCGLLNKQIAAKLGISQVTVKVYRRRVMVKLGARTLADLVRMSDAVGISPVA